jgi:hypothetical protein
VKEHWVRRGEPGVFLSVDFVRQINKGNMQVRGSIMQVRRYNPQVKESFWKVRRFWIKKVIEKW